MGNNIKLKKEHEDKKVGFNGKQSLLPLKERTDLDKLLDLGYASNDPSIFELFEEYPTLEELRQAKEEEFLKKTEASQDNKQ